MNCGIIFVSRFAKTVSRHLKSVHRTDILLLSESLMLLAFFGLVRNWIVDVRIVLDGCPPLTIQLKTNLICGRKRSINFTYNVEGIPSIPGEALEFNCFKAISSSLDDISSWRSYEKLQ